MEASTREQTPELRERILEATVRVVRERGMGRTRTSMIAHEAGCAEGSIYRYFSGKAELLLEAVRARFAAPAEPMLGLSRRAGSETVRANLLDAVGAALAAGYELIPLAAGILTDSELLAERRRLASTGDLGVDALADYLRAEQRLGRIRAGVDAGLAARIIVSSCVGEAFMAAVLERRLAGTERDRYVSVLVDTVLGPLSPAASGRRARPGVRR